MARSSYTRNNTVPAMRSDAPGMSEQKITNFVFRIVTENSTEECRENLKSYIALTDWALWRRRNVSPVKYKLGFYIPEDDILHSHRR
jgi:hypothetical protein